MKKFSSIVLVLILIVVLAACGNSSSSASPTKKQDGRVVVTFWHAMGGEQQKVLNKIVKDYNHSQKKVFVKAEYQGTYEESMPKYLNVGGTDKAPTIMQTNDIGTKSMIDSGFIQPVQKFIDRDNYDTSSLEKNVLDYYTVNNKLYSMPFNSSTPVLYYNADALKKDGIKLNPEDVTFEEIRDDAKKITAASNGQIKGFAMEPYDWMFEQYLANQNALLVNKDNGRSGTPTKAVFNSPQGKKVFQWVQDMAQDKTSVDYGTGANAGNDMIAGFISGKVAMISLSSAGLRDVVDNAKFKVGVAYLPHPASTPRNGVVVGGASLWMTKGKSTAEQNAAWDFMKYMETPHVQAEWHVGTGYFAINKQAYQDPIVIDTHKKFPQLNVTVQQLQSTQATPTTQGALMQSIPEARTAVDSAMESVYNGADIDKALNKAVEDTNSAIAKVNKADGNK